MDRFAKFDQFIIHVNSAVDVFTCLELNSEKREAILLLQNVLKTFESSHMHSNDEQNCNAAKYDGSTQTQDVDKLTCQHIEESTCQDETHHCHVPSYTHDVAVQEPGRYTDITPHCCRKKENTVISSHGNMLLHSAKDDILEAMKLKRENNHLKEELWKLVSVTRDHSLVTPGGDGGATTVVAAVLEEAISKAVFCAELKHDAVDVVGLMQTHMAVSTPATGKRRRGRPPKTGLQSPKVSLPHIVETTHQRRHGKAQGIAERMECMAEAEVLPGRGQKRKTAQDVGVNRVKRPKIPGSESDPEDCARQDNKTEVPLSGGVTMETNADSDTTVIYDEPTISNASTQKQWATKRKLQLKSRHQSKITAMSVRHKCEICQAAFSHGRPFKRHLLKHGEGDVSCRRCHDEFQNYALYLHHRCRGNTASHTHRGIKQNCSLCEETFHNWKKLQHHMNAVHHRKLDLMFFCEYCKKGFVKQASLYIHYKQHADGRYVCTRCGCFFDDEKALETHEKVHAVARNYTCRKCEETFSCRQRYMRHLAGHKKFNCIICGETFATGKLLDAHNKDVHGIEIKTKTYGCDYCGKKYPRPRLLELHLRMHTGEKPLECVACCLFFRTPKALYRHRQTFSHMEKTGETKKERCHLCATCGRSYFRKQALDRHMRYHSGVKPYQCPHCSYKTREHNNLKRHISLHFSQRDFICETCGDAFHAKKTLEVHVLYKHSDERPLQCTDCEMTFKTKNSLKRHRLIHQNLRLHKCTICDMSFNRFYNLRRHMRMVHGNEDSLPAPNKVRVLDAATGQEYRRPYRPPVKQPSRFVDAASTGDGLQCFTRDSADNPISAGLSIHSSTNQKHYTDLVPSIPGGTTLMQLQPVIQHTPVITPSILPQVNYVPISAVIGDVRGGATVTVPHQLLGASTVTTLQGLYPHPPQSLLHPQTSTGQPTDPLQHPHHSITPVSANNPPDNQDFTSIDIYSNLIRLMHPPRT